MMKNLPGSETLTEIDIGNEPKNKYMDNNKNKLNNQELKQNKNCQSSTTGLLNPKLIIVLAIIGLALFGFPKASQALDEAITCRGRDTSGPNTPAGLNFSSTNCADSDATTWCAASCSRDNINAGLDALISGGVNDSVLYIPAGNCEWAYGTPNISKAAGVRFRIQGAGQGVTVINNLANHIMFDFVPTASSNYNHGFRGISHMSIYGPCNVDYRSGPQFLRARTSDHAELNIHHMTLGSFGTLGLIDGYTGVVHDSYFARSGFTTSYGFYIQNGASIDSSFSFGGPDAIFFENNDIYGYGHFLSGFCNAHYVFRCNYRHEIAYQTCNGTPMGAGGGMDTHGPLYNACWSEGTTTGKPKHAGRQWEIYNNTFQAQGPTTKIGIYERAGSGIVTENTFIDIKDSIVIYHDSTTAGPLCTPANSCPYDITGILDGNCSSSGDGCCDGIDRTWVWGNTFTNVGAKHSDTNEGPDACRDSLIGVRMHYPGYCSNDRSIACDSSADCGGNACTLDRPSGPTLDGDGFNWAPYPYPHPLTLGDSGDTIPPSAPMGLTVQ